MTIEIRPDQQRMLKILLESEEALEMQALVHRAEIEQPMAMATVTVCVEEGWMEMQESAREEFLPAEGAEKIVQSGLPERRFLSVMESRQTMPMKEAVQEAQKLGIPVNEIVKWGSLRGWMEKEKGNLVLTEAGKKAILEDDADEKALKIALEPGRQQELFEMERQKARFSPCFFLDELSALGIDVARAKTLLKNRPELAKLKERKVRKVALTDKGRQVVPTLKLAQEEKNQLTSEEIVSGAWAGIKLRPYDVTLASKVARPKKCHPLQKIIQESRRTFLHMGFEEIVSPHMEVGFWDFDALFQPQDHPSRDMQDTFYLKSPALGKLPDPELVEKVKQTHENGWKTKSTGWGYRWSADESRRMILRTHTTAASIRAIAANPNPPRKVFCIGRVFRNETINFKHLPEFHQVEGIIIDEQASLCALLGTLQEFYSKMGFKKVKFKPSFFPYTEPSADVIVWMEQKQCWMELGGAGIFRPEVTLPFGCKVPVMEIGRASCRERV